MKRKKELKLSQAVCSPNEGQEECNSHPVKREREKKTRRGGKWKKEVKNERSCRERGKRTGRKQVSKKCVFRVLVLLVVFPSERKIPSHRRQDTCQGEPFPPSDSSRFAEDDLVVRKNAVTPRPRVPRPHASSHLSDEAAFHVSLLSSVKLPFALVPN